ncbi:hypothetical protein AWB83_04951 [Caballeronia ptereochthonis]|uniref:Uncharacterized protein n=2 Tax=Caballeronia ptereochthonis TaxID=1777144 RepID=A0A158D1J4_9BURK|nr:hypothetical protein AWB83_04951 [Caballeronia ptereochthonis]
MPVTLTYFPDTALLRITDSAGHCVRETRWPAPWRSLLDTLREFSGREAEGQLSTLLGEILVAQGPAHASAAALA